MPKYIVYRVFSVAIGFIIYSLFGAILAFIYLVLSSESAPIPGHETSAALGDFLLSSSSKKMEFEWRQINDGIFGILLKCAESSAPDARIAIPSTPCASRFGDDVSFEIPVGITSPVGTFMLPFRFVLKCGDSPKIKGVFIGCARVPAFFIDGISASLAEPYLKIKGVDVYVAAAKKIRGAELTSRGLILVK